jgi:hypothetical protein
MIHITRRAIQKITYWPWAKIFVFSEGFGVEAFLNMDVIG